MVARFSNAPAAALVGNDDCDDDDDDGYEVPTVVKFLGSQNCTQIFNCVGGLVP